MHFKSFFIHFVWMATACLSAVSVNAQYKTDITWKGVENVMIPVPPAGHPRLYLRQTDVQELESRFKAPVLQKVVDKLRQQADQSTQFRVEWDALHYLIAQDPVAGRSTIDTTLALLRRTELPKIQDGARVTGRMMVTGALVYDWLYPLLTPADKNAFADQLVRLAKTLECDYPPVRQGSVTGHSSESFVMRDMLSAGIALYDEYPEMYEHAAVRFFREHLPVRNWFYPGQAYHQGDSYGPHRYSWDTYPLMIFGRMGVHNVYNPEQQYVPYYYIYTTRPDGQRSRGGDTFAHSAPPGRPWNTYVGTLFTASWYGDGILLDYYLRQGGSDGNENIFQFLWWDTNLESKPLNTLPLTHYSGNPFGWMVARTGWEEPAVIAGMKINVFNFTNHQHLDAGSFQLYYKGPLATESGLYQGTSGGYGSPHCKNYCWRTIAHNSILVYNPDEIFSERGDYNNDGGQRLPNNRSEPRNLEVLLNPANGYQTGEVLAHGFGPSKQSPAYSILKGDITRAYSGKVSEVKRSFVFLNMFDDEIPAALIVFDKIVSTDTGYKKTWLLHSIKEPVITGNNVTIQSTGSGNKGKLVNTTLLPKSGNAEITKVGGPGKEFWVDGKNYENEVTYTRENSYERAAWRIELSPVKPDQADHFLNVMQVMDSGVESHNARLIEGDRITGVSLADRMVFFSTATEPLRSSISFAIDQTGTFQVLVTDLAPGRWSVRKDGNIVIPEVVVNPEEGTLYFAASEGKYELIPKF